jgi:hypothetical protein
MSTSHSDDEARAQAANAVEQGTTLLREHLSNHMDANPNSSYVTWIATLHPENASVTIDTRFLIPGNPWWSAYEDCKPGMPFAVAVPVAGETQLPVADAEENKRPHFCRVCSPIVLITGGALAIAAFLSANVVEIIASCMYYLSAAFFYMSKCLSKPKVKTLCLYTLFQLLYHVFAVVDSILLMTSVLITEILAASTFALIIIFGGHLAACTWHQNIRRTCHVTRQYHRKTCNPPRHFVCLGVAAPASNLRATGPKEEDAKVVIPTADQPTIVVVPTAPYEEDVDDADDCVHPKELQY